MCTIGNLLSLEGRVYVYLPSITISKLFLKNAQGEGFPFGDGVKPTHRDTSDIFALNRDWTINYVGWAGHMAFYHSQTVSGQPLIRVDYGKYLSGCRDFIF